MRGNFGLRWIAAIFAVLLILPAISRADIQYTVTDLGALPGDTASQPTGINNLGQISGWSTGANGSTAWIYSNGTLTSLGNPAAPGSQALALNNLGQVVGQTNTRALDGYHGFVSSNGVMQDIGGGLTPQGINDSGTIVGFYDLPGAVQRAFIDNNGVVQDLGTLPGGGSAVAYAINNAGQIAGESDTGVTTHAFLYTGGAMRDLGTLGGTTSVGTAINGLGDVVGTSRTSAGQLHAFLDTGGGMTDLGTLVGGVATFANGVNDSDQVIGYGDTNAGNRAFLYSNGTLYNLNDLIDPSLGVTLVRAVGINDAGQIIAWGGLGQLQSPTNTQAFLLTPTTPEPGACAIAGVAALGLLLRRRRDLSNRPSRN